MTNQKDTGAGWRQINLTSDDWQAAERTAAAQVGPLLINAEDAGILSSWWFVRKADTWRLRLRPADGRDEALTAFIDQMTMALTEQGAIREWAQTIYEPEIHAFGGDLAMEVAHRLFHADSRHLLHHLAHAERDHRRELGLLLATRLMNAAGQDWYEQGDVWTQVAVHRVGGQQPAEAPQARIADVRRLLTAPIDAESSPLRAAPGWPAVFQHAGSTLADLARHGQLTRGLRAVLAHHVLFALNRHGVSAHDQYLLACAASHVVFQQEFSLAPAPTSGIASVHTATVGPVTSEPTAATSAGPEQLRAALVDSISSRGTLRTPQVEAAFRTVPRHLFLPGVDLETAYGTQPVVTKRDADGSSISSASGPNLVAAMLEQLDVQPGNRILEIGAATGINAALLAELVGPTGTVVTIELDDDLATGAREALMRAGYHQVEVICGDGALGYPAYAPYDRIIITAEAWDLVPAWWQQLAVGGRLVVPVRMHGSGLTRALGFERQEPGRMVATTAEVCGFVPIRGTAGFGERYVQLADDVVLKLDADDLPDDAALAQALTHPAHEHWTGIQVHDNDPAQHLDLWLLTTTNDRFGRLSLSAEARANGLLNPARRWGGASIYDGATIAYIAARALREDLDELGVIAHGPESGKLAAHLAELLLRWDKQRPTQPTITAHRADLTGKNPMAAQIVRPHTLLNVEW